MTRVRVQVPWAVRAGSDADPGRVRHTGPACGNGRLSPARRRRRAPGHGQGATRERTWPIEGSTTVAVEHRVGMKGWLRNRDQGASVPFPLVHGPLAP